MEPVFNIPKVGKALLSLPAVLLQGWNMQHASLETSPSAESCHSPSPPPALPKQTKQRQPHTALGISQACLHRLSWPLPAPLPCIVALLLRLCYIWGGVQSQALQQCLHAKGSSSGELQLGDSGRGQAGGRARQKANCCLSLGRNRIRLLLLQSSGEGAAAGGPGERGRSSTSTSISSNLWLYDS